MKIAVLVKEVPDTFEDRQLDLETGLADRAATSAVLDEISERALEVALAYREGSPETTVTAVAMGPATASTSLRKALAMGADEVLHVTDPLLLGADLVLTADVITAVVQSRGFDLTIAGNMSTDGGGGVLPAMLAEKLDVPHLTSLSSVSIDESTVSGTREGDAAVLTVSAELPAVLSITEALPGPRMPTFKGIMAAKKKPYTELALGDLGVVADAAQTPRSIVLEAKPRAARAAGMKVQDDGEAATQLAEFLQQNRLI